jgi:hypothetical protein
VARKPYVLQIVQERKLIFGTYMLIALCDPDVAANVHCMQPQWWQPQLGTMESSKEVTFIIFHLFRLPPI